MLAMLVCGLQLKWGKDKKSRVKVKGLNVAVTTVACPSKLLCPYQPNRVMQLNDTAG